MRYIETELGLVPHELDISDNNDFKTNKFELINVYPMKLLTDNIFNESIIDQSPVRTSLIEQNHWDVKNLCCFDIIDDSMAPTLQNGSRILINTLNCC